jgi:aryl-alcohol dehydrogenase-like predicted oxidoreductase
MEDSERLLRYALDQGVCFFDTSDIYAQGDSERLLGRIIGLREDVLVCTKVGKYLPPLKQALVPMKTLIRSVSKSSGAVAQGVRRSRTKPMPTNWSPTYLGKAVDRSLRRLGRERLDILMLHSPSLEVIMKGEALNALSTAHMAGKVGLIGVSVDTPNAALAALDRPEVSILQIPLHPGDTSYDNVVAQAHTKGVAIVAREVLGGPNVIHKSMLEHEAVQTRLRAVASLKGVAVTLVGTTKTTHLKDAIDAFV